MSRPMTPEQWRRQMNKWKVPVAYRKGWEGRGRPAYTGPFIDVCGIMVHHTGSDVQSNDYIDFLFVRGRADLPAPLCHGATGMNGITHMGATGRANHAGKGSSAVFKRVKNETVSLTKEEKPTNPQQEDGNRHFYGNEVMFDGGQPMTSKQYNGLVRWCAAVCDWHGWTGRSIIGHGEWTTAKWDPGMTDMARLRRDVDALLKKESKPDPVVVPPKPKPKLLFETEAYTINVHGKAPLTMPARSKILGTEIATSKPSILFAQECYTAVRPILQRRLPKYLHLVGTNNGKVIWIDPDIWHFKRASVTSFGLGNGKAAVATLLRHRATGFEQVVSTGHLSFKPNEGARRIDQMERWAERLQKEWPDLPILAGGDLNDFRPANAGVRREAKRHGLRDPKVDLASVMHGQFNSYNGYKVPPLKRGEHIDGFLITEELKATRLRVDTIPAKSKKDYGSDHLGMELRFGAAA